MRVLDFTANAETVKGLKCLGDGTSRRAPAISLRLTCTSCGQRYNGTNRTPRVCPFCESDEISAEEAS